MKSSADTTVCVNDHGCTIEYEISFLKEGVKILSCRVLSHGKEGSETIEVPSKINGQKILSIGRLAFKAVECKRLVFPDCRIKFNELALAETRNIQEIRFLYGPATIPKGCFMNSGAEKITFDRHETIMDVNDEAFYNTYNLKEFAWPEFIPEIPKKCFYLSAIEKLTNVDGVLKIGVEAFECSRLKEFPFSKVKVIGPKAFAGCKSLETVYIPDSCKALYPMCFSESGLKSISNTRGIKVMGEGVFSVTFLQEFDWPTKITNIPERTFAGCGIMALYNTDLIKTIGSGAFVGAKIRKISFPSLTYINDYSFSNSLIEEAYFPETCESIPFAAFQGSKFLKKIYLEATYIYLDPTSLRNTGQAIDIYAYNCECMEIGFNTCNKCKMEYNTHSNYVHLADSDLDVTLHINFDTSVSIIR